MKPFVPAERPYEADFFSIYTEGNKRYIHIHGYSYKSDCMDYVTEDNPNGIYWANTECRWLIVELSEFVEAFKAQGSEYIDELYQECRQGQWDLTGKEMTDAINNYYGKAPDAVLDWGEIGLDTPDGDYITNENWFSVSE